MNDVEDLLREGMERFTKDVWAPSGLTRQAERRRRRRLAVRAVTAAGAATAAGAVALATVLVPAAVHGGSAVDTAYLVKRVSSALNAAEPGEIAQISITRSAAMLGGKTTTTTAEEWSHGNQWRSVTYSSTGPEVYDEGYSASSVFTLVSYPTRTWARARGLGRPNAAVFGFGLLGPVRPAGPSTSGNVIVRGGCGPVVAAIPLLFQPGLPGFGFSAISLPAASAMRDALSCGTLTVAGRQLVDGIDAIKLTSRTGSQISETIWVTPGTYLPVRVVVRSGPGAPVLRQTASITWLQPTRQNLAKLAVPIPAGFRQVKVFGLGLALLPALQQIAGWPPGKLRIFCLGPAGPSCKDETSTPRP